MKIEYEKEELNPMNLSKQGNWFKLIKEEGKSEEFSFALCSF